MITLLTKDGTRNGNAIIYGGMDPMHPDRMKEWLVDNAPEPKPLFFVETDFGNHMRLTWAEIEEMFIIGKVMDYKRWRMEREHLREQPSCIDEPLNNEMWVQS